MKRNDNMQKNMAHLYGPSEKRFIIWDPRDGQLRRDETGELISDGLIGRVGPENVYLTTYGEFPDERRPIDLAIGECIRDVKYSLSGSRGTYDIWRVR